ncbi:H-2 class II histocompatibility antigen, E-Q beta chain-like, partial [Plectropomus leopardus]|uniref:H-2 class II histocompatibility antigen, E-Q beta chain-like n=1 Tax=Plectropomus leopardus TaxID=160734 RepID=UPI001C4BCF6D
FKLYFLTELICFSSSDGFLEYVVGRCVFNGTKSKDIEYIRSYYFNKVEDVRFSSSVGKFVGYTEPGLMYAKNWNNDPSYLAQERAEKDRYCLNNVGLNYQTVLAKPAEP